ncbi:MAG: hypothetical protein HRF47_09355 [Chloroflexota bacterium]|jgi:hypothetical protein
MPYRLSPSDLTFLWDECPRCFYLKVKHDFRRPAVPFPSIFTTIDGLMKDFFQDQPTEALETNLPPGRVLFSGKRVQSAPLTLPGHAETCVLSGLFDSLLVFDDGSYGIVDFKTSAPKRHPMPNLPPELRQTLDRLQRGQLTSEDIAMRPLPPALLQ